MPYCFFFLCLTWMAVAAVATRIVEAKAMYGANKANLSTETQTPPTGDGACMHIGLSFIHEDFSRAFSLVEELRTEMKKFEVRGKTEAIMSFIERYMKSIKDLIYIALLFISLVIWLLAGFPPLISP